MSRVTQKGARIARRLVRRGRASAPATSRGERAPLAETGRMNPMQRSPDRRTWTGSSLSIAAPGMFPPSVLATWGDAQGPLAFGALAVVVVVGLVALAWKVYRGGSRVWPVAIVLLSAGVGFVAFVAIVLGIAIGECAPDAYECPF